MIKAYRIYGWNSAGVAKWGGNPKVVGEVAGEYLADLPINGLTADVDARAVGGKYNTLQIQMTGLWSELDLQQYDIIRVEDSEDGVSWTPRAYGDLRVPASALNPDDEQITFVGFASETGRFGEVDVEGVFEEGDLAEVARLMVAECVAQGKLYGVTVPLTLPATGVTVGGILGGFQSLKNRLDTLLGIYNQAQPGSPEPEFPMVYGVSANGTFFCGIQDGAPIEIDARNLASYPVWKRPDGEKPCTRVIYQLPVSTSGYRYAQSIVGSDFTPYRPVGYLVYRAANTNVHYASRLVAVAIGEFSRDTLSEMALAEIRLTNPANVWDNNPDTYASLKAIVGGESDAAKSIILAAAEPEFTYAVDITYSTLDTTGAEEIYVGVDVVYPDTSSLLLITRFTPITGHTSKTTVTLSFPREKEKLGVEPTSVNLDLSVALSTPADWLRIYEVKFRSLDTDKLDQYANELYHWPEEHAGELTVKGHLAPNRRLDYTGIDGVLHSDILLDSLTYHWTTEMAGETVIRIGQRASAEDQFYWRSIRDKKREGAAEAVYAEGG